MLEAAVAFDYYKVLFAFVAIFFKLTISWSTINGKTLSDLRRIQFSWITLFRNLKTWCLPTVQIALIYSKITQYYSKVLVYTVSCEIFLQLFSKIMHFVFSSNQMKLYTDEK